MNVYAYLDELINNPQAFDFRGSIWMPAIDTVLDYSGHRIAECPQGFARDRETRFNDTAMVLDWVSKHNTRLPKPAQWLAKGLGMMPEKGATPSRLFPNRQYLGRYDHMLAPLHGDADAILNKRSKNRTPPEGEFAVPVDKASMLINSLNTLFKATGTILTGPLVSDRGYKKQDPSRRPRAARAWVSMFIYDDNPLMKTLPHLLADMGARPHWGKSVFHRPEDVASLYPRWTEFCEFRNQLDPMSLFLNPFARSFGMGT